jgi:hypothetical protein
MRRRGDEGMRNSLGTLELPEAGLPASPHLRIRSSPQSHGAFSVPDIGFPVGRSVRL